MYYYKVWVRSGRYHGNEPLTYSHQSKLPPGALVRVELLNQEVAGFVTGPATRPRFKTKPISLAYELPPLPKHLLKLAAWMQGYYPAPVGIISQQLLPAELSQKNLDRTAGQDAAAAKLPRRQMPALTTEQAAAVESIKDVDTYLLQGVTGSGKTRVYIELAARAMQDNKSAIILTPEISLTAQLSSNFVNTFGEQNVVLMHSRQTPGQRQRAWLDCLRATRPLIVIGPRSALFCPVAKPGLIVLDESHEAAYKQEQAPQYQAGRVAAALARSVRAQLLLGSATPSVSDYYLAEQKNKSIVKMERLAITSGDSAPRVTVVDHKDLSMFTRSSLLSQPLIESVARSLAQGQQSLLYLNRRGTARLVMCQNCGWQAACRRCDLPLTYHADRHELRCHSCHYHDRPPVGCPSCGHAEIMFKAAGTKAVADEIKRLFPDAKVMRFDTDNLKAESLEQNYELVRSGKVNILVGTQLLAKGLDLPRLSTLGIVLADTSLYLPDFSANERTYQLISQALGRIGRGHVAGNAIIQTYHPDHPVLQTAISNDYAAFYKSELASRRQFGFPPFVYLLKLSCRRATVLGAERAALKLKTEIQSTYRVRVEGPAPSFYERLQGKYQWQLVVKAKDRSELIKIIANLPSSWSYDLDPLDLL